mgnify:CR=1 FL=1
MAYYKIMITGGLAFVIGILITFSVMIATNKPHPYEVDTNTGVFKNMSGSPSVCGPHTKWEDGTCVVAESACLSTTHLSLGQCVIAPKLADAMNQNFCVFYDHGGYGGGLRKHDLSGSGITAADSEIVIRENDLNKLDQDILQNPSWY